ncbi:ATP synthase subunit s, mitochondrial [Chrysoperla carnea]|uniref:ATP synthase subunit s, mitochondrial n=1 Tax=Chrysoperla carnea TaxID=189513 RepID=UPI001D088EA1|nr:ATP synthase subunit s, mitochondrial [Chrysoperla carnea]
MIYNHLKNVLFTKSPYPLISSKRNLFEWLNIIFNAVDNSRIKEIGPDRACAEWLIRNGASVKWVGVKELFSDYNSLSHQEDSVRACLEEIHATNASLRYNGFGYFKDLTHLKKIVFKDCQLIDDRIFPYLEHVKNSLQDLHLISCHSITDDGILKCTNLTNLKSLYLHDLQGMKFKDKILTEFQTKLPKCAVDIK